MKTITHFGLLKCFPTWNGSGNECLAECQVTSITEAVEQLQPHCPVPLDKRGYAKSGEISFVIGEFLS